MGKIYRKNQRPLKNWAATNALFVACLCKMLDSAWSKADLQLLDSSLAYHATLFLPIFLSNKIASTLIKIYAHVFYWIRSHVVINRWDNVD